jgi:threonine/homoserine/homoserine lactone efflux protein
MNAIIDGLGLGLLLTVLIGPVFFLLIRTSIEQGAMQALTLEIGVITGDFLIIVLAYSGTAPIFENPTYAKWLGIAGAFILMLIGALPFFKKKTSSNKEIELSVKGSTMLIVKGFALNVMNPFVYFFWIGSVGYAVTTFKTDKINIVIYFISCIICYLFFDLVKIYGALRIKKLLTPSTLGTIIKVSNIGIIILGAGLLIKVLKQFG